MVNMIICAICAKEVVRVRNSARQKYCLPCSLKPRKRAPAAPNSEKDHLKNKTRQKSHRLLANGILRRATCCARCAAVPPIIMRANGRPQSWLEMHHPDYSDEFNIVWLCKKCHLAVHGKNLVAGGKQGIVQSTLWAHNAYGGKGHKN